MFQHLDREDWRLSPPATICAASGYGRSQQAPTRRLASVTPIPQDCVFWQVTNTVGARGVTGSSRRQRELAIPPVACRRYCASLCLGFQHDFVLGANCTSCADGNAEQDTLPDQSCNVLVGNMVNMQLPDGKILKPEILAGELTNGAAHAGITHTLLGCLPPSSAMQKEPGH